MYQSNYGNLTYCFYDDCFTINGSDVPYKMMSNITHRAGNPPAFEFDYVGLHFAIPYHSAEHDLICPFFQRAYALSQIASAPDPLQVRHEPDPEHNNHVQQSTSAVPPKKKKRKLFGAVLFLVCIVIISFAVASCFHSDSYEVPGLQEEVTPASVRNDVTGSWKYVTISDSASVESYAFDYYQTCFEDGDQVHWIINLGNNTTNCIRDLGSTIQIDCFEHVEKEEQDAKTLGSGMLYASWTMDPSTGELTEISIE